MIRQPTHAPPTICNQLINLTPHSICLIDAGKTAAIPTSGRVERVELIDREVGIAEVDGLQLPIVVIETAKTLQSALPPSLEGTCYLVSRSVAQAHPARRDLLVPHDIVRSEHGAIVGCRSLAMMRAQRPTR